MVIVIHWLQRGHSVTDPTGRKLHHGKAVWLKNGTDEDVQRAIEYARKQTDWVAWRVHRA